MQGISALFTLHAPAPMAALFEGAAGMLYLYALTDFLILLSCYAIPLAFLYFVWHRKDLQHRWIFLVFSAFILSYGMSHLLSLVLLWKPVYHYHLAVKVVTALISAGTAYMVFRIVPHALKIPNPTQLAAEVEAEIQERREAFVALKTTEISLRESREQLRQANLELEARVESRTQELERQTAVLRRIIDSIPDFIILKDTNSAYLGSNKAFEEFTGKPEQEQIGKTDYDLFDSNLAVTFRSLDRQILETGQTHSQEEWVSYPDGRQALLSTVKTPFYGPNGEILGLVGISRDITDRVAAENSLRQAATVFESTREGVMITDADKYIFMVNRAFTEMLGYTEPEVLGRSTDMLQSPRHDKDFFRRMWTEIKTVGHWQGEVWNRRKDGSEFPQLLSVSAVKDNEGKVTQYVSVFSDISKIKETEAELEFLAHHDPLTRLPNRRLLLSRIRHGIETVKRDGGMLALLMLDLDRFKDVNDSFGHATGDELLQQVADRLNKRLRTVDTLTRLGGDEFTVLLQGITHQEDAGRVAAEIVSMLGEPWFLSNGFEVRIGSSVGITLFPDHCTTAEEMLQQADTALYQAKEEGRGRFKYFSEDLTQAARERIALEAALRRAITENELRVYYQPQVDIGTGEIVGAEALLRWQHPDEGMMLPSKYIAVAEETGLIGAIGDWVLKETCMQGKKWLDAGLNPITLAVNLSPQQFHHKDIAATVASTLQDTDFPPHLLELELTETILIKREHDAVAKMDLLREQGIRLAIDDFGTGYSSLSYLKRFPLDVLKIDKSFVDEIPDQRDDMEIANTVIAIGHTLGFKVLAEGVETEEQLAFLRAQGCDLYQGYLKSPPLPAEDFENLLRREPAMTAKAA
jgi:diguanylate cyclase (GGDEF)-like protein/PAS domain S-box-containing protein